MPVPPTEYHPSPYRDGALLSLEKRNAPKETTMSRFFANLTLSLILLQVAFSTPCTLAAEEPSENPQQKQAEGEKSESKDQSSKQDSKGESKEEAEKLDNDTPSKEEEKDTPSDKKEKPEAKKEPTKNDDSEDEEEGTKSRPETHLVERKPLKIDAEISALFVASETEEVSLRPETWSSFKVVEAVEHGSQVKKGDILVRFDEEKIEKELADEMLDQQLGELAMMRAEEEFPREKKLVELKLEEAKLKYEQLLEDFKYYQNTERPFFVEIANFRLQDAQESLASQKEELEQLEKMYAADELTEETEAIVLRRQRFEVETAELVLKLQTADHDLAINVQLPRTDQRYDNILAEAKIDLEQAKTAKENSITRGRYELEKKREARARSVERHSKLVSDKSLMVLRAPSDGTVYYGKATDGKWSEIASYTAKLKPYGIVTPNKVLMTIVKQRPLTVRATISESELPDFKAGMKAVLIPAGDKELELPGKVTEVATIPGGDRKYAALLEVDTTNAPEWLVAGMSCKANVTVYENQSALVIPTKYVQTDEEDEKIKYVMFSDLKKEKPVRRDVKLGREKGKLVEVLEGLAEGDEIVEKE